MLGHAWAADRLAALGPAQLGQAQSRLDPLHNHCPLEFGEYPHHLEHRLARGRGRVQSLLMQIEFDLERMQLREKTDEVLQAPPQSINAPGHDDIELPARGVPMQSVEGRPAVAALRPGDTVVGVDLDHLMPHAGRGFGELTLLPLGRLLVRANSQVKGRSHRHPRSNTRWYLV